MLFDQFVFVSSTLGSFLACYILVKVAIWYIPGANKLQVLDHLDAATSIMDPNAILAFIVGLVASIGLLIYMTSGSEFDFFLISSIYHRHFTDNCLSIIRGKAMLRSQGMATFQFGGEEGNLR